MFTTNEEILRLLELRFDGPQENALPEQREIFQQEQDTIRSRILQLLHFWVERTRTDLRLYDQIEDFLHTRGLGAATEPIERKAAKEKLSNVTSISMPDFTGNDPTKMMRRGQSSGVMPIEEGNFRAKATLNITKFELRALIEQKKVLC